MDKWRHGRKGQGEKIIVRENSGDQEQLNKEKEAIIRVDKKNQDTNEETQ